MDSSAYRDKHLVLYDGTCGFCNRWVQRIIARDPERLFLFASQQSATGNETLARFGKDSNALDTMYVVVRYGSSEAHVLTRSRAVLFICRNLKSPLKYLAVFGIMPTVVLDIAYNVVAHNRYLLSGTDHCMLPSKEDAARFIDA